jgi:hypothetical protein
MNATGCNRLAFPIAVAVLVAGLTGGSVACGQASAELPVPDATGVGKGPQPWLPAGVEPQCLFLPKTAIPLLAMGVRRIGDDPDIRDRRLLDLWERPERAEADREPLDRVPLFRPLYVYARQREDGTEWFLLGDTYAGRPRGWADRRHLEELPSRYGYHFSNPKRVPPGVHLYRSRADAYAALEAQSRVPPETPVEGVVVAERLEEENWNPLAENAIPPFIELPDSGADGQAFAAGLTDTTLTFPFPGENRLVHLAAVAGGPVDEDKVRKKKGEVAQREGIAIAFVIDETLSMQQFFGDVADFIDQNLDIGQGDVDVKVAVSWYSDIEKRGDVPHDVHPLKLLNGPTIEPAEVQATKQRIVKDVRDHDEKVVRYLGAQERELIYQGLIAAIERAGFQAGENGMVFVIGDAADRTEGKELRTLQGRLQELIKQHNLQMAFVQVGNLGPAFADQATDFRDSLPPELRDSVIVQGVNAANLRNRIAALQAQMDRRRTKLLAEIAEMETRNRFSQPGPALEEQFGEVGIDRAEFDRGHLQFLVPAWGWLYHPQQSEATPQLRELVHLAEPEVLALIPSLISAADSLQKTGRIDVEASRQKFAEVLARASGHSAAEAAIQASWQALPAGDRTFGRFLQDGLGLRVRTPILFHRGTANLQAAPTLRGIEMIRKARDRIGMARESAWKSQAAWMDAWKVLP